MRYFRADNALAQSLRQQTMFLLGQPNGMALEPWPINGDFSVDGMTYLALAEHHTEGMFWSALIAEALGVGATEITEQVYKVARAQVE